MNVQEYYEVKTYKVIGGYDTQCDGRRDGHQPFEEKGFLERSLIKLQEPEKQEDLWVTERGSKEPVILNLKRFPVVTQSDDYVVVCYINGIICGALTPNEDLKSCLLDIDERLNDKKKPITKGSLFGNLFDSIYYSFPLITVIAAFNLFLKAYKGCSAIGDNLFYRSKRFFPGVCSLLLAVYVLAIVKCLNEDVIYGYTLKAEYTNYLCALSVSLIFIVLTVCQINMNRFYSSLASAIPEEILESINQIRNRSDKLQGCVESDQTYDANLLHVNDQSF